MELVRKFNYFLLCVFIVVIRQCSARHHSQGWTSLSQAPLCRFFMPLLSVRTLCVCPVQAHYVQSQPSLATIQRSISFHKAMQALIKGFFLSLPMRITARAQRTSSQYSYVVKWLESLVGNSSDWHAISRIRMHAAYSVDY